MFAPGDEVVCVSANVGLFQNGESLPTLNAHYIVRDAVMVYDRQSIRLVEIVNTPRQYTNAYAECSFQVRCFRPVKRESIELFRAMCTSKKPLVPVEV